MKVTVPEVTGVPLEVAVAVNVKLEVEAALMDTLVVTELSALEPVDDI